MCLILFSYDEHPTFRLVLAANRDEYYSRPAEPASLWDDIPGMLAGRDLEQMGTWLGVTAEGKFSAITNYRAPALFRPDALSRGKLVSSYLAGTLGPGDYLEYIKKESHLYNPFNLLVGDKTSLFFYSSLGENVEKVTPGIHGLSNQLLDVPWPKVVQGTEKLRSYLENSDRVDPSGLFAILADTTRAKDSCLPVTGVGIERERELSPIFIEKTEYGYGTRSSTVLLIDRLSRVQYVERTFNGSPDRLRQEVTCEFDIGQPVFTFR